MPFAPPRPPRPAQVTFVGDSFTRKAPKYERFIRPTGLRFKKAHITHPELKTTFCLDILGVKVGKCTQTPPHPRGLASHPFVSPFPPIQKNPSSPLYTNLGVITKGTILEVNVSELGLVTQSGKVVWGKYAQVGNPLLQTAMKGPAHVLTLPCYRSPTTQNSTVALMACCWCKLQSNLAV